MESSLSPAARMGFPGLQVTHKKPEPFRIDFKSVTRDAPANSPAARPSNPFRIFLFFALATRGNDRRWQPRAGISIPLREVSTHPVGINLQVCPPAGHPNKSERRLGPPTASREPGPPCPPAGCSPSNNRPPGPPTTPTGTFPEGELFHSPGLPRQRLPRVVVPPTPRMPVGLRLTSRRQPTFACHT